MQRRHISGADVLWCCILTLCFGGSQMLAGCGSCSPTAPSVRSEQWERFRDLIGKNEASVLAELGKPPDECWVSLPLLSADEYSQEERERYDRRVTTRILVYAEVDIGVNRRADVVTYVVPKARPDLKGLRAQDVLTLLGCPEQIEFEGGRILLPPALTHDEIVARVQNSQVKTLCYHPMRWYIQIDGTGHVAGVSGAREHYNSRKSGK